MKIFGKIEELKIRQAVGIHSPDYNQWIIGTVQDVSDKITVSALIRHGIFSFDKSGKIISPSSIDNSYFLAYCLRLPSYIRFSNPSTILDFISNHYTDLLVNSLSTE